MKTKHVFFYIIILFSAFYSCYVPSKESLFAEGESQLVVEARVTNNPAMYSRVKLSLTVNGKSKKNYEAVNDAEVILINKTQKKTEKLQHQMGGNYKGSLLKLMAGDECRLEINYKGNIYSANEYLPDKADIRLLGIVYKDSTLVDKKDVGYYSYFVLKKNPEKTSFYKIEVVLNDTLLNSYEDLLIFDDRMYTENQIIKLPQVFKNKDKVSINFFSINEVIYNYYYALNNQTTNLYSNISPPSVNPKNNVFPDVLGYFNATSVCSFDTVLLDKKISKNSYFFENGGKEIETKKLIYKKNKQ